MDESISSIKPTDLRGILNYVPRFLGQTFVVSLDGSIIESDNLPNILLDIAVLRSLQINVVIVHGIGKQLSRLAEERSIDISNSDGSGPTDEVTLDLAIRASSRASHQILEALTQSGLKCAITNSVRSKHIGVIRGVDYLRGGRVDRIDSDFLNHLIKEGIIPIVQPIGFDRNGHTLRINSDLLAIETAFALEATKSIFLTECDGLEIGGEIVRQLPVEVLESKLSELRGAALYSKATHSLTGVKGGISRVHVLNGNIHDGLIREVFSNDGVGTLVYSNEYRQIRKATRTDLARIYNLTSGSVQKDELARRNIASIERDIENFYLYEIDGNLVGCVLITYFDSNLDIAEINALFVQSTHQQQGIGTRLVNFACDAIKESGTSKALALSTQSFRFFEDICGFKEADTEALPESRRQDYLSKKRNSKILVKEL